MNRKVFMERLRECLADISAEEREDALTYYESYFEEAGVENESSNMSLYPIRVHCSLFFRCSRAILSVAVVLISFNNAGGITISTGMGCLDPSLK